MNGSLKCIVRCLPALLFGVLVAGPAFADAPMARLKYVVPKAELAEGSQATVEKDGVKIIVELDPFLEKVHHKVEVAEESSWFIVNDKHTYEIQRIPASIDLAPRELRFKVRVINNLPNVLKMSGTVVSLTANGKQIPVPASAYSDSRSTRCWDPHWTLSLTTRTSAWRSTMSSPRSTAQEIPAKGRASSGSTRW